MNAEILFKIESINNNMLNVLTNSHQQQQKHHHQDHTHMSSNDLLQNIQRVLTANDQYQKELENKSKINQENSNDAATIKELHAKINALNEEIGT